MCTDRGVLAESGGHGAYCGPHLHPHALRQAQPKRSGTGGGRRVGKPTTNMSPVMFRRSIPLSILFSVDLWIVRNCCKRFDLLLFFWVVMMIATNLFVCFDTIGLGLFRPGDQLISASIKW